MNFSRFYITLLAATCLIAAGCFGGNDSADPPTTTFVTTTTTQAPTTTTTEPPPPPPPTTTTTTTTSPATPPGCPDLDFNRNGIIQIGVATAGQRNDGGYHQSLVEFVQEFSANNEAVCFSEPVIRDNIRRPNAERELESLAQQGVDIIIVGTSELAAPLLAESRPAASADEDPLPPLVQQYSDIFWYCNCGAGSPPVDGLAQSQDDLSEISFSAGYATGLLLQDGGGESAAFIGCCDIEFEREAYRSYELGLKAVNEDFTMTFFPTASSENPIDFGNLSGANRALGTAGQDGADAVYPFLAPRVHRSLARDAKEDGLIIMSVDSSDACNDEELDYDIAVGRGALNYMATILGEIANGSFREGSSKVFRVGWYDQVGAAICDPTPEQKEALDNIRARIANGEFADSFNDIKQQVYP